MWQEISTCLYSYNDQHKSNGHIAGFDLSDTLIHSSKGDQVPRKADDWLWMSDKTPDMLSDLNAKGWTVVIFSNWGYVKDQSVLKDRFENMVKTLNFRPSIFYATRKANNDKYYKPNPGMWYLFLKLVKVPILPTSFYVGDKAGPMTNDKARALDDTDYKFAKSAGIEFYDLFDIIPEQQPPNLDNCGNKMLIINVGVQGAGKSTLSNKYTQKGWVIIKRKKGTHEKQIDKVMKQGLNIVFDATDPTVEDRAPLIQQAKDNGYTAIIFWFSRSGWLNNSLREGKENIDRKWLTAYVNKFETPTTNEGATVYRVN